MSSDKTMYHFAFSFFFKSDLAVREIVTKKSQKLWWFAMKINLASQQEAELQVLTYITLLECSVVKTGICQKLECRKIQMQKTKGMSL